MNSDRTQSWLRSLPRKRLVQAHAATDILSKQGGDIFTSARGGLRVGSERDEVLEGQEQVFGFEDVKVFGRPSNGKIDGRGGETQTGCQANESDTWQGTP